MNIICKIFGHRESITSVIERDSFYSLKHVHDKCECDRCGRLLWVKNPTQVIYEALRQLRGIRCNG